MSSLVGVASDVMEGSSLMVTVVRVCEKDTEHGLAFPPMPPLLRTPPPLPPPLPPPPAELALPLTEVTMTVAALALAAVDGGFWTELFWF